MRANINIRKAGYSDLEKIRELVIKLAIFENEPDAVSATLEDYQNNFKSGLIEILLAEQKGHIIGIALYYLTFSTWKGKMLYLEDFIVEDKYRSLGIGQLLFEAFIKEAKAKKCKMVKWQVLDWNTAAIKFYKKNNAEIEEGWWNGKIIF